MKEDNGKTYILDTSALLTYIEDEKGSDIIDDIFIKAEKGEEKGETEALRRINLIQSLSLTVEESNEDLNLKAGRLKAANRISLADAYVAALCQQHKGVLVHKDPEFESLSSLIKEHRLPYKTS